MTESRVAEYRVVFEPRELTLRQKLRRFVSTLLWAWDEAVTDFHKPVFAERKVWPGDPKWEEGIGVVWMSVGTYKVATQEVK